MSNMGITEGIAAQVERFEDYCFRVRSLEGNIELVLARRDHAAVEAVQLAEHEMEDTEQECAEIEARVERARQGDFEKAEKSHLTPYGDPIQSRGPMKDGGTSRASKGRIGQTTNPAPVRPEQQQAVAEPLITLPFTNLSSLPAFSTDSDDFSVISSPKQRPDMSMDEQTRSKTSDHSEDNSSDDFLTLLVQRYTDICYERRTLQEEIEERLEKKKRMASEKLRCAKIALEATRRKAVEIVAALNEASGGETQVNLPAGSMDAVDSEMDSTPVRAGATAIDAASYSSHTIVRNLGSSSSATVAPGVQLRTPTIIPSFNVLNVDKSATCTLTAPTPLSSTPSAPFHTSADRTNPITTTGPCHSSPESSLEALTPLQFAIFEKYEQLMLNAKSAGRVDDMPNIPWPILTSKLEEYPLHVTSKPMIVGPEVMEFARLYCRWKSWTISVCRDTMLMEWKNLGDQITSTKIMNYRCISRTRAILESMALFTPH
jgi:hypothetical protein